MFPAIVKSTDPAQYTVDVVVIKTGQNYKSVPMMCPVPGWNWMPSINSKVLIGWMEGQWDSPICLCCYHNSSWPSEITDDSIVLLHPSGTQLTIDSTGAVTLNTGITIQGDENLSGSLTVGKNSTIEGNETVKGTSTVTGKVSGGSGQFGGTTPVLLAAADVISFLNSHVHSLPGGGDTGAPTSTLPADASASNLTAD